MSSLPGFAPGTIRRSGLFPLSAAEGSIMLRQTTGFLLVLIVGIPTFASSPDPKSLAIPNQELTRARELVHQLGSEEYDEREKAEAELVKMGRLARPALVEAANTDPSQEVRSRCTSLLPRASALDIKARLDVFLADTDGKYDHDLPGWAQFQSTVRGEWTLFGYTIGADRSLDQAARSVFVDLVSSHVNRPLVMAVDGSKSDLSSIVTARRQELYLQKFPRRVAGGRIMQAPRGGVDPSVEDIATLLFLESSVSAKMVGRNTSITNLITSSGFVHAVNTTGDRAKVYRAIAAAWFDSRNDPFEMYQIMTLASTMGLSEHGCRIGIRLLTAPGVVGAYRGLAASNLAHIGNKEHIPLLEKALADSTVGFTIRKAMFVKNVNKLETYDVQVRDMALAAAIILAGENIKDYGFVDAYASNAGPLGNAYSYNRHYIPDGERSKMHEKWKAWWAAHEKK
jgi:hypothetical protein